LIGFGLAEAVADVDAEAPRKAVERAKVAKQGRTATVDQEAVSVAQISQSEDAE